MAVQSLRLQPDWDVCHRRRRVALVWKLWAAPVLLGAGTGRWAVRKLVFPALLTMVEMTDGVVGIGRVPPRLVHRASESGPGIGRQHGPFC